MLCAHAANDSLTMPVSFPFPVSIPHVHFRFGLIMLVTFEVSRRSYLGSPVHIAGFSVIRIVQLYTVQLYTTYSLTSSGWVQVRLINILPRLSCPYGLFLIGTNCTVSWRYTVQLCTTYSLASAGWVHVWLTNELQMWHFDWTIHTDVQLNCRCGTRTSPQLKHTAQNVNKSICCNVARWVPGEHIKTPRKSHTCLFLV